MQERGTAAEKRVEPMKPAEQLELPGVKLEAELVKGSGNDGTVEIVEKQKQLSHPSHRHLGISPKARDSHISTARLRGPGKVENQNRVFHFPTTARDDDEESPFSNPKTKKGSRPLRGLLLLTFQDHAVLETEPDFRIILGSENAPARRSVHAIGSARET